LSEELGFLQIIKEASSEYEQTTTEEMSAAPAPIAVTNQENV